MKASYDGHRWWVAPLSKIATSLAAAPAAAKMAVGWVEITIARVSGMVAGRVDITDTMLVMVEDQRVTTLLMTGVRLVGERMVAL